MTAPPIIFSAKLVEYAFNDDDVEFTDRLETFIANEGALERLGEVPCLAICQVYAGDGPYQLYFCTRDWEPKAGFAFATIEEAKLKAERGYKGISNKWNASPYTNEDINNYLRNEYDVDPKSEWWQMTCSFCGRTDYEIDKLVQSPRATICEECVASFHRGFQEASDA